MIWLADSTLKQLKVENISSYRLDIEWLDHVYVQVEMASVATIFPDKIHFGCPYSVMYLQAHTVH